MGKASLLRSGLWRHRAQCLLQLKSGSFHQCTFCSGVGFCLLVCFVKKREKKTRNHNPNPALARPAPFEERRFPRATLKPGGLILLPGMSVQIQSGSADCWGGGGGYSSRMGLEPWGKAPGLPPGDGAELTAEQPGSTLRIQRQ